MMFHMADKKNDDTVMEAQKTIYDRMLYRIMVMAALLVLCVAGFLVSVRVGSLKISIGEVISAIFIENEGVNHQIIWNVRLPRTIVAALVGMCLALSGAILQGIMRNPLADPSIIGVSSGAGVAAITIMIVLSDLYYLITPFAFLGALAATVLIYFLAWKDGIKPMRMILAGVAVSSFLGAWISTLMIFYPEKVQGVIGFMVGGLIARTWKHVDILWPYAVVGFILVNLFAKRLNILMLGDEIAVSLGLRVERTRMIFIAISSLLAASAVSVAGLLGFVGLIVPHITRMLIGSDYRYLFPASALMGAALLMICDIIARMLMDPVEIPVGIIMAMLGAPFFLYLLRGGLQHGVKSQ